VESLLERGILGGLPLGPYVPDDEDMQNCLLVCATEKRTSAEIEQYARALEECLGA
jgi:glycine dehydrogenase subunit 1